jgi:integrase
MNITEILHNVRAAQLAKRALRTPSLNDASLMPAKAKAKAEAKPKIQLTERGLKSLQSQAPYLEPFDVMDTDVRAFGVRVLKTGEITFMLRRRFPGSKKPTRRALGRYGEKSLAEAREKARDWIALIRKGIDPARAAEKEAQANIEAERKRKAHTVGAVLQSYFLAKCELRSLHAMKITMERELKPWLDRPLLDISTQDIRDLVNKIKADGHKGQARVTYTHIKSFFSWVIKIGEYGLESSPCSKEKIDTETLVGQTKERERILDDREIAAYWRASERLAYPTGPYFKMLLLTALRRCEVSDASRDEIDRDGRRWIIPSTRMKQARAHLVPVTLAIASLLDTLPEHAGGPFLFSITGGAKPVSSFSQMKANLDKAMTEELAKEGRAFKAFGIHDVRRTVRSKLSELRIGDRELRERLLAHTPPKIQRTYDVHEYADEKRIALETWSRALAEIVKPRPALRVVA